MFKKIISSLSVYAVSVAIPVAVGLFSAFITKEGMDVYTQIETPPLSPPSWIFPIVWSILYLLMGISCAMVWQRREGKAEQVREAYNSYVVSLVLNFAWSVLFFNARMFLVAFFVLLALLYYVLKTVRAYVAIRPLAGYLQLPYAFWVAFAGYLNAAIWFLNR